MPDSGGLVQKNSANVTQGKHIHNYSTFDRSLSYRLFNTIRFGDYTPSFVMEGVPTDEIQLNSLDRIDSLSLNAPFKGSIRKIKESFAVPNMAILPMNWDRIYAQPADGDDVPVDANCVITEFPTRMKTLWTTAWALVVNNASASTLNTAALRCTWLTALLRTMVLGEYVYSAGSLLNVCGYKASAQFRYLSTGATKFYSYDAWFDLLCAHVFSHVNSVEVTEPVGGSSRIHRFLGLSGSASDYHYNKSFRSLLELFRENPLCVISTLNAESNFNDIFSDLDLIKVTAVGAGPQFILPSGTYNTDDITDMSQTNLNLSRILAYQLVCAHYFTNSSIDFLFSAELYRQYVFNIYQDAGFITNSGSPTQNMNNIFFSWNGQRLHYDFLSGHVLKNLLFYHADTNMPLNSFYNFATLGGSWSVSTSQYLGCFPAFAIIFGYRKSLRYGDYFVASRPRPLAPINTDVSVNSNMVSVIDITRNIQAQRFANAVMRSRSKIENYVKSLFGKAPAPDYHNPFFLTRSEEIIFGDEVQNTADAQAQNANSRTSNFASNISPYTFTFHNDDSHPCIYFQIISFDVRRAYTRSVERQFLHADRFDMFNPDFQYVGDQKVYGIELGYPYNGSIPNTFAYQSRDMEYKERFDQACSGFVENLPGWILTDGYRTFDEVQSIDPDFIRSYNTELDQFYLSLSGFSLGSYFHFTCITDNNVNARRPMAVDPQILA